MQPTEEIQVKEKKFLPSYFNLDNPIRKKFEKSL